MTNTANNEGVSPHTIDRMGFSLINGVIIALLLWVGSTVNQSQIEVAGLKVEIAQLHSEMNRSLDEDLTLRQRVTKIENELANLKARLPTPQQYSNRN